MCFAGEASEQKLPLRAFSVFAKKSFKKAKKAEKYCKNLLTLAL